LPPQPTAKPTQPHPEVPLARPLEAQFVEQAKGMAAILSEIQSQDLKAHQAKSAEMETLFRKEIETVRKEVERIRQEMETRHKLLEQENRTLRDEQKLLQQAIRVAQEGIDTVQESLPVFETRMGVIMKDTHQAYKEQVSSCLAHEIRQTMEEHVERTLSPVIRQQLKKMTVRICDDGVSDKDDDGLPPRKRQKQTSDDNASSSSYPTRASKRLQDRASSVA
jgi:hypothetical protein